MEEEALMSGFMLNWVEEPLNNKSSTDLRVMQDFGRALRTLGKRLCSWKRQLDMPTQSSIAKQLRESKSDC